MKYNIIRKKNYHNQDPHNDHSRILYDIYSICEYARPYNILLVNF